MIWLMDIGEVSNACTEIVMELCEFFNQLELKIVTRVYSSEGRTSREALSEDTRLHFRG